MATATYKGYTAVQAKNNHVMVIKDGRTVLHAPCEKRKTSEELMDMIDALIVIRESEA